MAANSFFSGDVHALLDPAIPLSYTGYNLEECIPGQISFMKYMSDLSKQMECLSHDNDCNQMLELLAKELEGVREDVKAIRIALASDVFYRKTGHVMIHDSTMRGRHHHAESPETMDKIKNNAVNKINFAITLLQRDTTSGKLRVAPATNVWVYTYAANAYFCIGNFVFAERCLQRAYSMLMTVDITNVKWSLEVAVFCAAMGRWLRECNSTDQYPTTLIDISQNLIQSCGDIIHRHKLCDSSIISYLQSYHPNLEKAYLFYTLSGYFYENCGTFCGNQDLFDHKLILMNINICRVLILSIDEVDDPSVVQSKEYLGVITEAVRLAESAYTVTHLQAPDTGVCKYEGLVRLQFRSRHYYAIAMLTHAHAEWKIDQSQTDQALLMRLLSKLGDVEGLFNSGKTDFFRESSLVAKYIDRCKKLKTDMEANLRFGYDLRDSETTVVEPRHKIHVTQVNPAHSSPPLTP